jgi:hypothetical protein
MCSSRRQYIFQFGKWGLCKYNTNVVGQGFSRATSDASLVGQSSPWVGSHTPLVGQSFPWVGSNAPLVGQSSPWVGSHALSSQYRSHTNPEPAKTDGGPSQQPINPASRAKRPQSLAGSLREKPPVPPKKRQKLDEFLASRGLVPRDPYADLGRAFDTPQHSVEKSQPSAPVGQMNKTPGGAPLGSFHTDINMATPAAPSSYGEDVDMATPSGASLRSIDGGDEMDVGTPRMSHDDYSWEGSVSASLAAMSLSCSESLYAFGYRNSERSSSQERLLDPQPLRERPIDSSGPIDNFSPDDLDDIKLAADFLSGMGCEEDAFALYVLLLKRVKTSAKQPSWMISSAIISCAACAFTSSQIEIARHLLQRKLDEGQDSTTNIEKFLFRMLLAETYVRVSDDLNARSHIEIAMGLNIADDGLLASLPRKNRSFDILMYHYLTDGLGYQTTLSQGIDEKHPVYDLPFLDEWEAWSQLLQQVPGPFELQGGSMRNPCLRSCLQWCIDELGRSPTLSDSWNLVRANRDTALVRAEVTGIYCCLWERSQSQLKKQRDSESMIWADQAESLMGIPAAELLKTICSLVISASLSNSGRGERDLVRRAHTGAKVLSERPDDELGSIFLDRFSSLRTFFNASQNDVTFKEVRQAYAKNFIEKRLRIKLPDVLANALQASTPRQSFEIIARAFAPTLAPSLRSSDKSYRTLKDTRDRLEKDRGAMTEGAETLPSSFLKDAFKSNTTLLSMSELSARASSLSLSSFQQAASSAFSNVRDRAATIEGGLGEVIQRRI